jgi:hypothetical protein
LNPLSIYIKADGFVCKEGFHAWKKTMGDCGAKSFDVGAGHVSGKLGHNDAALYFRIAFSEPSQ